MNDPWTVDQMRGGLAIYWTRILGCCICEDEQGRTRTFTSKADALEFAKGRNVIEIEEEDDPR